MLLLDGIVSETISIRWLRAGRRLAIGQGSGLRIEETMTSKDFINETSHVKRDPSLLSSSVDDDLILFSADRGMYYGTQAVGSRIWALIEDEVSVSEVCDKLFDEFSVDRLTCEREVLQFVEQLAEEGMVTVR